MPINIAVRSFLHPAGLKNRGNTCFFNATMQCFLSLPNIVCFFKQKTFDPKMQPISTALQNFILDYQNEKIYDPQSFISAIKKKIKLFDGRQQDAHCFLENFLNILIDEQKCEDQKDPARTRGVQPSRNALKLLFNIRTEDLISCIECGFQKTVVGNTITQYLFIKDTIQEAFELYEENIDVIDPENPWQCPECKRKGWATIKHKIIETSEYVIIHLNRFLDAYSKNNKGIKVNAEIRLNGLEYTCVGIVCHVGDLNGGHYFCKARRNKQWYIFNDSNTNKADEAIESNQPYLVFYSRKSEK